MLGVPARRVRRLDMPTTVSPELTEEGVPDSLASWLVEFVMQNNGSAGHEGIVEGPYTVVGRGSTYGAENKSVPTCQFQNSTRS